MITAYIGSCLFFLILVLYILLAAGAPLGELAMGGRYKRMPKKYRIACAVSVLVQAFAILVLLQLGGIFSIGLHENAARVLGYIFAAYLILNVFMNAKSKSKKEKLIMTPISAIIAFCFLYTTIVS